MPDCSVEVRPSSGYIVRDSFSSISQIQSLTLEAHRQRDSLVDLLAGLDGCWLLER